MAYVTYAERMRHSIGLKKGRAEGLRDAIEMTLATYFGEEGKALLPSLQQIVEPDTLHALLGRILNLATLDETRAVIEEARGSAA